MRIKNGCIAVFVFMMISVSAQTPVEKAVSLFNHRHEKAVGLKADSSIINNCISILEAELKKGSLTEKIAWYHLLALNFKARFVLSDEKDKKNLLDRAALLAETYCHKFPLSGPILFEYITSIGLRAEITGILANATNGVVEKMRSSAQQLVKLDSMYGAGNGWKVLGILYCKTPYVPLVITWPDKKISLKTLEKALHYFPADIPNNFYYAEALLESKETEKARIYFNLVLKLKGREYEVLEDLDFRIKATNYLKNL